MWKRKCIAFLGLVLNSENNGKNRRPFITYEDKKSLSQRLPSIGTYIQFLPQADPKTILVTSARQAKEKQLPCEHCRHPRAHHERGISSIPNAEPQIHRVFDVDIHGPFFLSHRNIELDQGLIQKTKVENLDVIRPGLFRQPSELLSSYASRIADRIVPLYSLSSLIRPCARLSDSLCCASRRRVIMVTSRKYPRCRDTGKKTPAGVNAKILVLCSMYYGSRPQIWLIFLYYSNYYGDDTII